MNEKQSEAVAGIMDEIGYIRQDSEESDVVIIIPVLSVKMQILKYMAVWDTCTALKTRILT